MEIDLSSRISKFNPEHSFNPYPAVNHPVDLRLLATHDMIKIRISSNWPGGHLLSHFRHGLTRTKRPTQCQATPKVRYPEATDFAHA